jgi:hypothetical protein
MLCLALVSLPFVLPPSNASVAVSMPAVNCASKHFAENWPVLTLFNISFTE